MKTLRRFIQLFTISITFLAVQSAFAFYNPQVGRWANRDPLGEEGGINLYGICENNSINQVDPWGLVFKWPDSDVGDQDNLDDCLNACDKICIKVGPIENCKSCYCYCWKKFPPTPRGKSPQALIADWQKSHPGERWPTCANGKPAEAHHIIPLADQGKDDGCNIKPLCPDKHKDTHKNDFPRWGKRRGRTCKNSDPLDTE